ncbi:PTS sugar transporter subunit IIA [Pectinatus cerevisiiphilus]|uniref:PTS system IIA component (Fru family) n=1 Tax=Pectinatus cerevisiiphilus TaxID=86956 RepID=A0A4R3KDC2_9FIRM|nr:fructose PTS transporter subunit IIA [Pectinatus cerevisiiphilus]TCS81023.1 PTS system IIA component (Fru family) [Pectinatus cerevisiiphilus]
MISRKLIFIRQSFQNRLAVIDFIAAMADKAGMLHDQQKFIATVLDREADISTSIGYGIAIPHGKTDAVKEAFIAYVNVKEAFEWDNITKDRVKAIFLIGVPEKHTNKLHLKAISEISKKLINNSFREELFRCQTEKEAFKLLNSINKKL